MDRCTIGATAVREHVVRAADCATKWENDLPVLATPVLLWLAEVTAMRVIENALEPGEMTVGVAHANAEHLAATPRDWAVTVTATLSGVDGKKLAFSVVAHDGEDLIYRGEHTRAVIDRDRFLRRFSEKAARKRSTEAGA